MQDKRDTHSGKQLPLEFDTRVSSSKDSSDVINNVVQVQFWIRKNTPASGSNKDQALIERILQSAQKLKW
jgi:hypothetical protein